MISTSWRTTLAAARAGRLGRLFKFKRGGIVRTCATIDQPRSGRLDRLRSGIAFELQRGCQNYPGQTMLFSDFLVGELRQIVCDDGTEVDPLLASARDYGRWDCARRRAFLASVEAHLDASNGASDAKNRHHYYPFVVDTETTGFSTSTSHVVELCVLDLLTGANYLRRVRLPSDVQMHPGAEAVTGISSHDLRSHDLPTFDTAMAGALEFIFERVRDDQTPLLVGHNILKYDVRLLRNRMLDYGMTAEVQQLDTAFRFFDTLAYAKAAADVGADSNKLTDLYRACVGSEPKNAHSSLGDVVMTREVLARLAGFGGDGARDWEAFFGSRVRDWVVKSTGPGTSLSATRGTAKQRATTATTPTSAAMSPSELLDIASSESPGLPGLRDTYRDGSEIFRGDDGDEDGPTTASSSISLSTPLRELGVAFTPTESKLMAQMRLETVRDVLYVFPRGYLVASVGAFPVATAGGQEDGRADGQADGEVDQSIVLPVHLDALKVYRGKFHVLNAQFRCLDYDDLLAGTHLQTMHRNPVIHLQVFRKGRSAAWAIMNEEKRIRGFGSIFALSGQVKLSTDKEGNRKFVLKEASLELFDLNALSRLPRHAEYLQPIYPQKSKATSQSVSQIVSKVLERVETTRLINPIPAEIRGAHGIASYAASILDIHRPQSAASYKHSRSSLAFHELFFMQLRLLCRSRKGRGDDAGSCGTPAVEVGVEVEVDGAGGSLDFGPQAAAIGSLAFPLTGDQKRALESINELMNAGTSASILLQGDVGCGKTIVALLAAHAMSSNGKQVAFMAPTEVLAEQHIKSLEAFCASMPAGERRPTYALLTGSTKQAERRVLLERLVSGELDILVGTHALISAPVQFRDLGLAIVDEQHKFGVEQRAALLSKAAPAPHMLNMSATPIPRSLALVLYGEMELIEIQELPPGRTPVATTVWIEDAGGDERDAADAGGDDPDAGGSLSSPTVATTTRARLAQAIKTEIDAGGKCFIVCPLIDKGANDESSVRTAVTEKERLCATDDFAGVADTVGLLHGRMSSAEKEQILSDFADPKGTVKVLISTTVVEVGVNVPDASLMIIEHAERFGLAQLHQLRGRVGRGSRASRCILVTGGDGSADRLRILEETNNGFDVAEADLANRGSGNIIGTEQAGDGNSNHLWELPRDAALVSKARQAAADFLDANGADERGWNAELQRAMADAYVDLDVHSIPDLERLLVDE